MLRASPDSFNKMRFLGWSDFIIMSVAVIAISLRVFCSIANYLLPGVIYLRVLLASLNGKGLTRFFFLLNFNGSTRINGGI